MPKIEVATKWNTNRTQKVKFYPVSITPGIIDTARSQRLSVTIESIITSLAGKVDNATLTQAIIAALSENISFGMDADTGDIYSAYDDGVEEEEET